MDLFFENDFNRGSEITIPVIYRILRINVWNVAQT